MEDNKVLVTDSNKAPKLAASLTLGMIAGLASQVSPIGSFGDPYMPKPKKEHIPHTGKKERERRMKRLIIT